MPDSPSTQAPRALVTGATGLLGRQVVAAFKQAGWATIGTGYSRADPPRIYRLDLNDSEAVGDLLKNEL